MHAGANISSTTVRRHLLETGKKVKTPLKKLLTQKMKIKLEWAKNVNIGRGKKVLFSDESHFRVHGKHSRFVRTRNGEQLGPVHFNEIVKHPKIKKFWESFSFSGVVSLNAN